MALTTKQVNDLTHYYKTYGCHLATLLTGNTRKTVITHAKLHGLTNPPKEEVNERLVQLIKTHEGIL